MHERFQSQEKSLDILHERIGSHFEASRRHAGNTKKPAVAGGLMLGLAIGFETHPRQWGAKERVLAAAGSLSLLAAAWERLQQETNIRASAAALGEAADAWRPET